MNRTPFYDYFDNFDCDPSDCNGFDEHSEEFDYYETTTIDPDNEQSDSEQAEDFDYEPDGDPETSEDFEYTTTPDDELAATTDGVYDTDTTRAQQKCALDDYEIISDVLGSEKELVKLYSTALCESAEEPLRDVIRENLVECAQDQYATYKYMSERGMYPTENAPEEKILQAKQQFTPLCNNDNIDR